MDIDMSSLEGHRYWTPSSKIEHWTSRRQEETDIGQTKIDWDFLLA
jgi:hypothetical protein